MTTDSTAANIAELNGYIADDEDQIARIREVLDHATALSDKLASLGLFEGTGYLCVTDSDDRPCGVVAALVEESLRLGIRLRDFVDQRDLLLYRSGQVPA